MKKGTTKENQKEYVFLLRDLVYCKNCGRKMLYKNSNPMRIDKYGKVTGAKNELGYFICAEHYRHQDICNEWIKIKENTLNEIVLKQISNKLKKLQLLKYANDVEVYKEIMDPEASECKKIKNEIELKLKKEGLNLKENWQLFKVDSRPVDFIGYRYYRGYTTLRRGNFLRIKRRAKRIYKRNKVTLTDASAMISYYGWLKHCNSYNFNQKYIRPYIDINKLKGVVSYANRKFNKTK